MTRNQVIALFVVQVIPIWLSLTCCGLIFGSSLTAVDIVLFALIGIIIALWARSTLRAWYMMADLAVHLSDEAVSELDDSESEEIQIAQTMVRMTPPRQMYACAIARRGEPVRLLRGWKTFSGEPLVKPEDTRTKGFSCRVIRY
jgi:hypothetical protein